MQSNKVQPQRLSPDLTKELFANVDNFLFDCDGVLWNWNVPVPGAVECVNKLKQMGKKCYFITNNFSKSRLTLYEKMIGFGMNVVMDEIICNTWVFAEDLKERNFDGKVYVMGDKEVGLELDRAGIRHCGIGPAPTHPDPEAPFFDYTKVVELDPEVKCVIVGIDHHLSFIKLSYAISYLHRPDCLFYIADTCKSFKHKDCEIIVPGNIGIIKALQAYVTHKEPIHIGKPYTRMFEMLQQHFDVDPARSCMIGDTLEIDMAFAKNCSMAVSLAVLTGNASEKDVMDSVENDKDSVPAIFTQSLADLNNFLNEVPV